MGQSLFYLRPIAGTTSPAQALMRVAIEGGGTRLTAGQPDELFAWSFFWRPGSGWLYDVGADGRFLMVTRDNAPGSETSPYDIVVVQNWLAELTRRVPTD